jgi:cystathionine beta-synthase
MSKSMNNSVFNNVLGTIGHTPLVRLKNIAPDDDFEIYGKLEFLNPGGSIKDRLGLYLIEDAEKRGTIKPGGTIIEGTSGNTGMGLAIASAIKGYKCIFVLPDKMSEEKIKNLRAFGAKVVVTPTAVEPDDPRSYYSVSKRLAKETPNSLYIDQYNNLANREMHYHQTGPEILEAMPDIDYFIAGIGTGGTICGTGKFLKEKKPDTQVVAVDPIGSIVYDHFKTGKMVDAHPYKIEGIGEDFIPGNYDYSVIDDMVQVEDEESFLMTRELLLKEGIFSGVSSGSAVVGALRWMRAQGEKAKGKKAVVIICDSGNRYLSKVYDDDWMREAGFLKSAGLGTVQDLMTYTGIDKHAIIHTNPTATVDQVTKEMRENGISQLPVRDEKGWIKGLVTEEKLLKGLFRQQISPSDSIDMMIDSNIEFVSPDDHIEKITKLVTEEKKIPLVQKEDESGKITAIITSTDLLAYLGRR